MDWQSILITAISAVATVLASWIVSRLTNLINTKVKDAKLQNYLNASVGVVSNVVKAMYQTYVESIKGTDAWTADAQKTALTNAVETAKTQLSGELKEYIQTNFGDVDKWLVTQIESAIYDCKKKPKEVVNAGT